MVLAPASIEFSIISFNALAGRCTTSPAAMRLTTCSSRRRIGAGAPAAVAPSAMAPRADSGRLIAARPRGRAGPRGIRSTWRSSGRSAGGERAPQPLASPPRSRAHRLAALPGARPARARGERPLERPEGQGDGARSGPSTRDAFVACQCQWVQFSKGETERGFDQILRGPLLDKVSGF